MTRLDQNRAISQLAKKAGVANQDVKKVAIWGNHSATQFPDFYHATIKGQPATATLDRDWLTGEFLQTVQERGTAILQARGASSAASAANAIIDSVVSATTPTAGDDWHSLCLAS